MDLTNGTLLGASGPSMPEGRDVVCAARDGDRVWMITKSEVSEEDNRLHYIEGRFKAWVEFV